MAAPVAGDPSQQPAAGEQLEIQGRCKILVAKQKEYLSNILRIAGKVLVDNATTSGQSSAAGVDPAQFALLCENTEKFYSICDQLEALLRLALAWQGHAADARKHLPFNVTSLTATRLDTDAPPLQSATGTDLSRVIQLQVVAARELHDLLADGTARFGP